MHCVRHHFESFVCFFVLEVLGFELRTLCLLRGDPPLEPCPQSIGVIFLSQRLKKYSVNVYYLFPLTRTLKRDVEIVHSIG
jgi:hypothetical protein